MIKVLVVAGALLAGGALIAVFWPALKQRAIYPGGTLSESRADPVLHGLEGAEQVWLEAEDGVRVHAWWTPARSGDGEGSRGPGTSDDPGEPQMVTRGTVLYCHGNAETMATRAWIADRLARRGYDVLLFDYRGYGLSEGRPSEEGLARDARAAWRHVVDTRGEDPGRVVLMGHSLGSAVATRLALELEAGEIEAGRHDGAAALVVGSPFPDMPTLFRHHAPWLPGWALRWETNTLDAGSRLGEVSAPVLVLIGTEDETIPPEISRKVMETAELRADRSHSSPRLVLVPADHGTMMGHPDVWTALDVFLDGLLDGTGE